jgi:hypothetical protein
MSLITKLSSESQQFLTSLTSANLSRSAAVTVAISKVLTDFINIPSSPVEDPILYYNSQLRLSLEQQISMLNELVIIDTAAVLDVCLQFFNYRYKAAHPSKHVYCLNKDTCLEDFFNLSRNFEQVTLHTIKNDGTRIAVYMNGFNRLLNDVKG